MSSLAETTIHLYIYITIGALGDITCVVLLLYHIVQFYKHEFSKTENSKFPTKSTSYQLMSVLTMLTLIGFALTIVIGTSSHFICILPLDKVTPLIYNISKCSMYLLFIIRLHYVYNKSKYAYNKRLLQAWSVILIVVLMSYGIFGCIEVFHYNHKFNIFGYDVIVCQKSHGPTLLFFTLSFEIVNTVTTLVAFIRPLIKIMKSLEQNYSKNYRNKELKYPVIKISILTLVASITTLFAVCVSMITDTDTAFIIDIPFNSLCIMLMTNYYTTLYEKLCCGFIKCISLFYAENVEGSMAEHHVQNKENQIDENKSMEYGDTWINTATIGITPDAIKYENESELTQTVKI